MRTELDKAREKRIMEDVTVTSLEITQSRLQTITNELNQLKTEKEELSKRLSAYEHQRSLYAPVSTAYTAHRTPTVLQFHQNQLPLNQQLPQNQLSKNQFPQYQFIMNQFPKYQSIQYQFNAAALQTSAIDSTVPSAIVSTTPLSYNNKEQPLTTSQKRRYLNIQSSYRVLTISKMLLKTY